MGCSRREWLRQAATGFGAVALASLLQGENVRGEEDAVRRDPWAPKSPHFAAKARSVIFLYMDGGPSQVEHV